VTSFREPVENLSNKVRPGCAPNIPEYPVAGVEVARMKFVDSPSDSLGQGVEEVLSVILRQVHAGRIDDDPNHCCDWLVASAALIAVAEPHRVTFADGAGTARPSLHIRRGRPDPFQAISRTWYGCPDLLLQIIRPYR
jgi:hypothetical protein